MSIQLGQRNSYQKDWFNFVNSKMVFIVEPVKKIISTADFCAWLQSLNYYGTRLLANERQKIHYNVGAIVITVTTSGSCDIAAAPSTS